MRNLLAIALAGVLIVLFWIFVQPIGSLEDRSRYQPKQEGETLSIRSLSKSERVAIVYRAFRREGNIERLYQIEGGEPGRIGVKTLAVGEQSQSGAISALPLIGTLSEAERIGLDSFLLFLRHGFSGGGAHDGGSEVVVGYYRGGTKVGEERFQDALSLLSWFRYERGKIVVPDENPGPFPQEVFREIVPPWLIEERLKTL